ncbi:MAG: hypothetical protein U0271_35465 [Polyangiaceae bacterium]
MAIITILGAGMMGSALAVPLVDRGHTVRLVGTHLDTEIVERLERDRFHIKLALELPSAIEPFHYTELADATRGATALALGVSSAGIAWACEQLSPYLWPGAPLFMITKGLELGADPSGASRLVTLPDAVKARLPAELRASIHPAAVAGPCIAGELARRVPTCVVLAGRDRPTLEAITALLDQPGYRVVPTTDVVGAEVSAALKNAYAMGIAFGTGMHERAGGVAGSVAFHNLESLVMAESILEMTAIAAALGGSPWTVTGLAGVGDLDVTTNGGRTGRFGKHLGRGLTLPQAIEAMQGATLECLEILAVLRRAFEAGAIPGLALERVPLLEHMIHVALDGAPVDIPISRFFADELQPGARA